MSTSFWEDRYTKLKRHSQHQRRALRKFNRERSVSYQIRRHSSNVLRRLALQSENIELKQRVASWQMTAALLCVLGAILFMVVS